MFIWGHTVSEIWPQHWGLTPCKLIIMKKSCKKWVILKSASSFSCGYLLTLPCLSKVPPFQCGFQPNVPSKTTIENTILWAMWFRLRTLLSDQPSRDQFWPKFRSILSSVWWFSVNKSKRPFLEMRRPIFELVNLWIFLHICEWKKRTNYSRRNQ